MIEFFEAHRHLFHDDFGIAGVVEALYVSLIVINTG